MTSKLDQGMSEGYSLSVKLRLAQLFPQAVMFTLFDHDPHAEYVGNLKALVSLMPGKDQVEAQATRCRVAWDQLFHKVAGNNLHLATPDEIPKMTSDPKTGKMMISATTTRMHILTNEDSTVYTCWVVTRTALYNGKPIAWCIPVQINKGSMREILLEEPNLIDLMSLS